MNYCKLYRFLFVGIASFALTLPAMALSETRLQVKAHELEMRGDYLGAIRLYEKEKAHRKPEVAAISLQGMAQCYKALGDFEQAESAYEMLVQKSEQAQALYEYAEVLLRNGNYAQAKQKAREAQKAEASYADRVQRLVTTCNTAERWEKRPTRYAITNLSDINTCYSEWGAMVTSSQEMLFSSDRPVEQPNCANGRQRGASFSRAFAAASAVEDSTLTWELSRMLPPAINKTGTQVGPFSMAAAGMNLLHSQVSNGSAASAFSMAANDTRLLYYTRTGAKSVRSTAKIGREKVRVETGNLGIYAVSRSDYGWGEPVPFEYNDPEKYSVMHPCLSHDGQTLYFVSDMPGGLGGMDLWYCEKQEADDRWSPPVNMGASVNTVGNEVFPATNAEGALYFSSDGHPGMGGLDIFFTQKDNDAWATPKNMGAPVNSSADDFSFVFDTFNANAFGRADVVGYFSSNRPGGQGGDDIYMFVLRGADLPPAPVVQPDTTFVPEDSDSSSNGAADSTDNSSYYDNVLVADVAENVVKDESSAAVVAIAEAPAAADTVAKAPAAVDTVAKAPAVQQQVVEVPRITLTSRVVDKSTRQPLSNVKICATHDATRTSECKECGSDGKVVFLLQKDSRYTVSGFKEGYHSTDPIRILSTVFLQEEEMAIEMAVKHQDSQSAQVVIDRAAIPALKKKNLPREYCIQILANWIETDWEYFTRLRRTYPQFDLQYTKRNSGTGVATRFIYGSFHSLSEARRHLRLFIGLGYTDAFITVFEYGKQVESIYGGGSRHVIN
jgi:tetratricopeptide (TPR) repeat protein